MQLSGLIVAILFPLVAAFSPPSLASPLHDAAEQGDLEEVARLVEAGADVNETGRWQATPLHRAAENGHFAVVELLIRQGADVNALEPERFGYTPLHYAARRGYVALVDLLVRHGADVNAIAKFGATPLGDAARRAEYEGRFEAARLLIEWGADVNIPDDNGDTPLLLAARAGHAEFVDLLIRQGAEVHARDNDGNTPLHAAIPIAPRYEPAWEERIEVVRLLVEAGADVNARDNHGNTPLHDAASSPRVTVVEFLIDQEADLNAQNKEGETPLFLATREDSDVAKVLRERGAVTTRRNLTVLLCLSLYAVFGALLVWRVVKGGGEPEEVSSQGIPSRIRRGLANLVVIVLLAVFFGTLLHANMQMDFWTRTIEWRVFVTDIIRFPPGDSYRTPDFEIFTSKDGCNAGILALEKDQAARASDPEEPIVSFGCLSGAETKGFAMLGLVLSMVIGLGAVVLSQGKPARSLAVVNGAIAAWFLFAFLTIEQGFFYWEPWSYNLFFAEPIGDFMYLLVIFALSLVASNLSAIVVLYLFGRLRGRRTAPDA